MPDLRKKPEPLPVTLEPRRINQPGLIGEIPFTPGKIFLTGAEKEVFKKKFGWKDGDPIPNLSQVVKAEVGLVGTLADMEEHVRTMPLNEYPEDTPDFVPPEVISIDDLTPAKQKEIADAITNMRITNAAAAKNKEVPFIPRDPSIGQANAIAMQQAMEQEAHINSVLRSQEPTVELVNDRAPRRATVTRASNHKHEYAPVKEVAIAPPEFDSRESNYTEPVKEDTGVHVEKTYCQHCGWRLDTPDDVVLSDEDKATYMAALLGGKRFVKTYDVFDGDLRVTLRGMTTKEYEAIKQQLFLDGKNQKITTPAEVFFRAQEYQLVCCLQMLDSDGNHIDVPEFATFKVDLSDTSNGLPDVLDWLYENVVPQDSLRRIILPLCTEFNNLQAKMEVESRKPGFSRATGHSR